MSRRVHEKADPLPTDLRDAIAKLDAPHAPRGLIGRIAAERARGERAAIPSGDAAVPIPPLRPRVLAAAVVVLVAGAAVLQRWPAEGEPNEHPATSGACAMNSDITRLLTGSALFLSVACGQEPADRLLAPAPAAATVDARALREGTWVYGTVGKDGEVRGRQVYRLSRNVVDGDEEWLAVSTWHDDRRTSADSLHLASDGVRPTLRILRKTIDGRDIRFITMTYGPERLDVVADFPGYPSYRSSWSATIPGDLAPVLTPAHGPGYGFAHIVQLLPLREGWSGAVYVAPAPAHGYKTESLRVTGEGTIRVPAGTFDCWRVVVGPSGQEWLTLWVTKDSRQLVKVVRGVEGAEGAYELETVLVSFEPA